MLLSFLLIISAAVSDASVPQPASATTAVVDKTPQQRYVNENFGFAFNYPDSWVVLENRVPSSTKSLLSVRLLNREQDVDVARDYSPGSFAVEVFDNPTHLPLREWLELQGWPFGASDRSVTSTSVAGRPALEITTGKMFSPNRFIYVSHDHIILRLSPIASESSAIVDSFSLSVPPASHDDGRK
jgi:hypothetical protein